jgi:hypothetical protein
VTVTGALTDTQLRASAVPVSAAQTGTWTVQPGNTANTTPWLAKISDGTNAVAIKGAYNAAIVTDPALVVAVSPLSATLPVSIATMPSTPVTGTFWQATQPVSIATSVPITDNAGSITVDAPVGTPAFVRLSDGTAAISTLPVSLASVPSHAVTNAGTFAVQAAQTGTWTVQPGNTANTTPWLVKPAESLGTATALAALNSEISQALNGNLGVAAVITATATPSGIVLTPYVSYDGGTNWTLTQFFNSANGDAISTLSAFTVGDAYSISAGDGATHVKVRTTSWTSGSITVRLSATNSQGLVNLKATAVHDETAGSFVLQTGAVASSTAPTAVSANGDAVRLWATTSGALNIADGGSTISIDDGAGSITVDGTVGISGTVTVTGALTDTQLRASAVPVSLASVPTHGVTGTFWQATQPVSIATSVPITDNAGSITVDAPVGTPAFVRLSDGTTAISTLPVSLASVPTHGVTGTFWQATQPVSIASTVSVSGSVTLGSIPLVDISSFPTNSNTGAINALNGTTGLSIGVNNGGVSVNISAISAPTGITIIPEISLDGSTWTPTYFFNPQTAAVTVNLTNAELSVGALRSIIIPSSVLSVRLKASTWTSGSVTFNLLNSDHADSLSILSTSAINSTARPPAAVQVAGWDGTNLRGLSTNTSGHVNIADGGNSITVDGTVGISGTVPVSLASVPTHGVTGTFWQATQPVSIAASVAVTGALTDTQLRASAVPVSLASVPTHGVTGTFWQATQPVSIASTITTKGQSLTNNSTTAYATSLIIKASAGSLYIITGFNSKTTDQFIQLHDSTTLPADTAIPKVIFRVAANSNFSFDLGVHGRAFTSGIVVCNSSTGPTKTIGAADCWFDCQYI